MPRPQKPGSYPAFFRRLAEQFRTGEVVGPVEIDCAELCTSAEDPEKYAQKLRFRWYGFKKALEKARDPLGDTLDGLELLLRGPILVIQSRDDNKMARLVEAALERQGIRMFTPREIWGERQQGTKEPYDMGVARKEVINEPPTEEEKQALEQQWLKEGVQQTKHFEEVLVQLGFTAHKKDSAGEE